VEKELQSMGDADFEQLGLAGASGLADFVPVVFAEGREKAEQLRAVLETHHIPTLIDPPDPDGLDVVSSGTGVPLLVPSDMFDEATEILAVQDDEDEEDMEEDFDDEDELDDPDEEDEDEYDDEEDEDFFYEDEDFDEPDDDEEDWDE
jgi:hypothetical protein